jgi:hypothetical protein
VEADRPGERLIRSEVGGELSLARGRHGARPDALSILATIQELIARVRSD